MKTFYNALLIIFFLAFFNHTSQAQWCGSPVNGGTITPTTSSQNTPVFNSGTRYYTFTATAGCEYTFSTCGLSTNDTYLRLYDATGATELLSNDDFTGCGTRSQITFLANVTATYTIHVSAFSCANISANTQISYIKNCTFDNRECFDAEQLCADTPFSSNTNNFGPYQNLNASNRGCLATGEHQSYWYYFIPTMNGTINMNIQTCATCDYDFAIWSTGNCGALGAPVRCSYDVTEGTTGLSAAATDVSEPVGGTLSPNPTPKYVNTLSVVAGQTYIMLIDNYTANNEAFNIDFTFSDPLLLNCTPIPLPVNIVDFMAEMEDGKAKIHWSTKGEMRNDYFSLLKSEDGVHFVKFAEIDGPSGGNSSGTINYSFYDENPYPQVTYYKVGQTDFDGKYKETESIALQNVMNNGEIRIYPNPARDNLTIIFSSKSNLGSQVKVMDLTGNIIQHFNIDHQHGVNDYTFSLDGLSNGVYYLELSNEFEHRQIKFMFEK